MIRMDALRSVPEPVIVIVSVFFLFFVFFKGLPDKISSGNVHTIRWGCSALGFSPKTYINYVGSNLYTLSSWNYGGVFGQEKQILLALTQKRKI